MARNELRIGPFEAQSHFRSIANLPDPKTHWKIPKSTFPKIREIWEIQFFASITLVCPVKADTDICILNEDELSKLCAGFV